MISPRNGCSHAAAAARSFRFMTFITFECRDKTCLKKERLVSVSSLDGKTVKWIKNSRSSCPEVFCKKEVLKNVAKFTGKHLYWRLLTKEFQVSRLYHNLLEQFPHMSNAKFCYIIFIRKYINRKREFFKKIEAATGGVP